VIFDVGKWLRVCRHTGVFFVTTILLVPSALLVALIWSVITLYVIRAGSGVQERLQTQHTDTPARVAGLFILMLIPMLALWQRRMTSDATSPPATKSAVQTSLWRGTDFAVTSNAAAHDIIAAGNNGVIISFPTGTDRSVINDVTAQVSGLGVLIRPPGRYRWTREDGLRSLD
jgi:hypothetical protein